MLGSSKMYIEPTNELPKEVARFILWDSPPDKVLDLLSKLKYSSPTSLRYLNLVIISSRTLSAMAKSSLFNFRFSKNFRASLIDNFVISEIFFPFILINWVSFLNLDPRHSSQDVFPL